MGEEGGGRESSRRVRRKRKGEEARFVALFLAGSLLLRRAFSGATAAAFPRAALPAHGPGAPALEWGRGVREEPPKRAPPERSPGLSSAASRLPQGQPAAPGKPSGRAQELPVRGALLGAPGVGGCQPSRLAAVGGSARVTGGWSGEEWRRGERGEEGLGEGRRRG